jgi:hypothetical protein
VTPAVPDFFSQRDSSRVSLYFSSGSAPAQLMKHGRVHLIIKTVSFVRNNLFAVVAMFFYIRDRQSNPSGGAPMKYATITFSLVFLFFRT